MPAAKHRLAAYFLVFASSGFSGLIYESIWTHYLKLFLGHAAYAQSLVLGIFMGGMALGSWICGRYSGGWRRLLLGYAAAAGFPIDSMVTLTHLIFAGVLERFHDLQVIVLESSGGWIYSWLERLEHHQKLLPSLRPGVKRGALEQFHDQVWVSFDPDEKTLPAMVQLLGDDRFVWASDYPHFDATFPGATRELREVIAPLPADSQRRILGENARRLYGI